MSLCVTLFGMQVGRKGTILIGCLLICIGALLQASTYSVAQIIVGRIVTGSGIGCIASAVPTYMVCATFNVRFGSKHRLTITTG
jgi:fucose permease